MRSFINGCFDILHYGHFNLIEYAASLGSLTVGINSDDYIRRVKKREPYHTELERFRMLRSFVQIENVYIFNDSNPEDLLISLYSHGEGPLFLVKGSDYRGKFIPERKLVEEHGGKLLFIENTHHSTSGILHDLGDRRCNS